MSEKIIKPELLLQNIILKKIYDFDDFDDSDIEDFNLDNKKKRYEKKKIYEKKRK